MFITYEENVESLADNDVLDRPAKHTFEQIRSNPFAEAAFAALSGISNLLIAVFAGEMPLITSCYSKILPFNYGSR